MLLLGDLVWVRVGVLDLVLVGVLVRVGVLLLGVVVLLGVVARGVLAGAVLLGFCVGYLLEVPGETFPGEVLRLLVVLVSPTLSESFTPPIVLPDTLPEFPVLDLTAPTGVSGRRPEFTVVLVSAPPFPLYTSPVEGVVVIVLSPPGRLVFTAPPVLPLVEFPPTLCLGLFAALLYLTDPLYLAPPELLLAWRYLFLFHPLFP